MVNSNTRSFFEKVYDEKVSKTDQLLFIKEQTDYELNRLIFLRYDLDEYLDNLQFINDEVPDAETLGQRLQELEAQGKEIPFLTFPNSKHREAFFNDDDIVDTPEYIEEFLNVPKLLGIKKYYSLLIFREYISKQIKTVEESTAEDKNESFELDLSHTKATEKIIYLNELGIIEHLRNQEPFKNNINKLATVLSAITGVAATTLQPSLNSMLSTTNSPEKNPYHAQKTAPKIKAMLTELGYFKGNDV